MKLQYALKEENIPSKVYMKIMTGWKVLYIKQCNYS
ncbi:hypothetical protein SAAL107622_01230 [Lacicoccus alkaliphilus]